MRRRAVRQPVSHVNAAVRMRAVPGVWLPVGLYRARSTAVTIAESICTGHRLAAYLPAGSFEAHTEPVGDETGVTARFVGVKP